MIRSILIILFLILFFLAGIVIWGITWIIGKFDAYKRDIICLRSVQLAFKVVLLISGVKVEVHGEENVPKDEAVLYIGNHRSLFDTVITYARCPRLTGYVSKDSMLKIPFLRIWMKRLHCLFLDRTDIKAGMKMILTGIDQIKNGISMCIFPEGTRSLSEIETEMLPFKEGSFKMAEKSGCPIIPMAMVHTADIFEKHIPFVKGTRVILTYGEPIYVKELEKEQKRHLGSYVQEVIRNMLEEELKL
ncbi:MAG: 1-acyl-sn-glycerol-3-phosphate acyltransferase [Eubacterium sp.]|nr:1-acyl-sn-glycerol-3-phosphate acyltransferase [Eubacterium sp.]